LVCKLQKKTRNNSSWEFISLSRSWIRTSGNGRFKRKVFDFTEALCDALKERVICKKHIDLVII